MLWSKQQFGPYGGLEIMLFSLQSSNREFSSSTISRPCLIFGLQVEVGTHLLIGLSGLMILVVLYPTLVTLSSSLLVLFS